MSRNEKLIKRLLTRPKDFSYDELRKLLLSLGYAEDNIGKTSGSAVRFTNDKKHIIRLHKPHPSNILKPYIVKIIIDELIKEGVINE